MMVCVPRASESELEVDGLAADVLNRQQLSLGRHTKITEQCIEISGLFLLVCKFCVTCIVYVNG